MTIYYPSFKPAVSPLTMITKVRELPMAGEVVVRVGNRVEPDEIIARTLVPSVGRRFAVAQALTIDDKDLAAHMLLEDGAEVELGATVARAGQLRQRVWKAPIAGTLSTAEVGKGYLVITPPAQNFELRANMKGFVSAIEPYRSVTLQTPAALVQGAFGLGGEQHGVLRTAVTAASDELLPEMLDERSALSILVGGGPVTLAALLRAVELRVRGLIVGSIPEEVLRAFLGIQGDADWDVGASDWVFPPHTAGREFPMTLVVTEGLGRNAMNARAFSLLTSYDGSETTLDGTTWLHGQPMQRPQVIIPVPRANQADINQDETAERFAPGFTVRLLGEEMLGQVGTIVALPRILAAAAAGLRYRVADVRLDDGQVLSVPLENLESLGQTKGKKS